MITYRNSNNKQDYNVLFNKASMKLGLIPIEKEVVDESGEIKIELWRRVPKDGGGWEERLLDPENAEDKAFIEGGTSQGISSLNEYFQHIHELAEMAIGIGSDSRSGSDPYLLRLPLDEPFLEINANTRAITVPTALRQIAVKGDKYAEIVFFKIDRYYDAVDLATRHIYIEWEDAAGNKGISRDFLKDTQSEKDKIIFGWIIDDTLTANVGNIRFAVRFVEWDDGKIDSDSAIASTTLLYSFSSLPAQMTVVDSLNYSLFENDEELNVINTLQQAKNIMLYLQNSDSDSADETTPQRASEPEFLIDLSDADETLIADLVNGEKELVVEAVPSGADGGVISYTFAYKPKMDEGSQGLGANIRFRTVPKATAIAEPKHMYYQKETNGTYTIISQAEISELEDDAVVYAKEAFLVVGQPGYYFANVRNNVSGKKTNVKQGDVLYIRYAEAPEVTQKVIGQFVLNNQPQEVKADPEVIEVKEIPTDMGTLTSYSSNLYVDKGAVGANSITLGLDDVGPIFEAPSFGEMKISWYKKELDGNKWIPLDSHESTLEVTKTGYYTASATVSANNSKAEIPLGDERVGIIKVVNMPKMSISSVKWNEFTDKLLAKEPNATLEVQESGEGEVSYKWHLITKAQNDLDEATENEMEEPSGKLTFVNGVAQIPFKPLVEGRYYIELKKKLYGAEDILLGLSKDDKNLGVIVIEADNSVDGGNASGEPTNQNLDGQGAEDTNTNDSTIVDGGDEANNN